MNRQLRENHRRNPCLGCGKNGEAGKIRILSSNAQIPGARFRRSLIKRDEKLIPTIDESKCGIWSVNNCQNNWKFFSLGRSAREPSIDEVD